MVEAFETDPEAFAELMVELTDPFAERAATLARAGLDEAALERLSKRWSGRFAAEAREPAGSAQRFAEAFGRARERYRARAAPDPRRDEDTEATLPMAKAVQDPLPFHAGQSPPRQAFESAVAHARAVQGTTAPRSPTTDSTADLPCVIDPPTLPAGWRESGAAAAPARPRSAGGTVQLSAFVSPVPAAVLPEEPLDAIRKPSLTLEQYAWLCAELGEYPEHKAKILLRYGLEGDDAQRDEDTAWARRFTTSIDIGNRWHYLVAGYRQWLAQQRKA